MKRMLLRLCRPMAAVVLLILLVILLAGCAPMIVEDGVVTRIGG